MEDKIKKVIESLVLRKEVAFVVDETIEGLENTVKNIGTEMKKMFKYGLETSVVDFVEKEGKHVAYITPPGFVDTPQKTQCTGE